MVTCKGNSLVPIHVESFQNFVNSIVPKEKLPEFEIKLDGRAKVKSVFAKLEEKTLTLYTGAIVGCGSQKFPEIYDALSLLMLFTIYGIKKAGQGQEFEVKSTDQGIADVKTDVDFKFLSGNLKAFVDRFAAINEAAIQAPAVSEPVIEKTESVVSAVQAEQVQTETHKPVKEKSEKKTKDSPYKGVPLENTPQIDVPEGLDLRTA